MSMTHNRKHRVSPTLIGFTGPSGSGKSTLSALAQEILQSAELIHGDVFMFASAMAHQNEFEEIFGVPLDINDPVACLAHALDICSMKSRKYLYCIADFIEEQFNAEISRVMTDSIVAPQYIILDWIGLSFLNLWKLCEHRIVVDAPLELIEKRLQGRDSFYTAGCGAIRYEAVREILRKAAQDAYQVYNGSNNHGIKKIRAFCAYLNHSELSQTVLPDSNILKQLVKTV